MTLFHHAAVTNRQQIITALVQLGLDINIRKISNVFAGGTSTMRSFRLLDLFKSPNRVMQWKSLQATLVAAAVGSSSLEKELLIGTV